MVVGPEVSPDETFIIVIDSLPDVIARRAGRGDEAIGDC